MRHNSQVSAWKQSIKQSKRCFSVGTTQNLIGGRISQQQQTHEQTDRKIMQAQNEEDLLD